MAKLKKKNVKHKFIYLFIYFFYILHIKDLIYILKIIYFWGYCSEFLKTGQELIVLMEEVGSGNVGS